MLSYNKNLKRFSRNLRSNMTDAELLLWSKLRLGQLNGNQFLRQKTIGNYIVDFYSPQAGLAIEVDGSQHHSPEGLEADRVRDLYLSGCGLKVLRFTDTDVFTNIEGVVETILRNIEESDTGNPP